MRVVQVPNRTPPPKKRHRKRRLVWWLLLLVIIAGLGNYLRPLPAATISLQLPTLPAPEVVPLAWPNYGQAAVGAAGYGLLASHGDQTPLATASIAKVITALCVLQKQPLQPGQSGPNYTVGQRDMAFYTTYASQDGSLVPVALGEKLTEYQALQALLLPSANNIADSFVYWVFGSQSDYATYATQFLSQNGLNQTHIGSDASGFDPSTTSTAEDLTRLGLLAAQNPVLMDIASQQSANLPVAGRVQTYDTMLGVNGITGLKTGNSDADPGAFLFTANVSLGGKQLVTSGVVMGAGSLNQALQSAAALAGSLRDSFQVVTVVAADQIVGKERTAWGASTPIVASKAVTLIRWKGSTLHEQHAVKPSGNLAPSTVGTLEVSVGGSVATTPLKTVKTLPEPGFWWRLTRH